MRRGRHTPYQQKDGSSQWILVAEATKKGQGIGLETDRQQKKESMLRLTRGNQKNLFKILFTRAEDSILTLLAHPGDQVLLLGKLAVKSFNFTAAGHAFVRFHLWDPVREEYVCRSWLDAGRVWDREVVVHANTCLAVTSFRYPHVLQLAFCECSA